MSESKTYIFFVYAPDYTDADAFDRRMSVRSHHLELMAVLRKKGILRMGGSLVAPETLESDQRKLIGSGMLFETESADALRKILEEDVYWRFNVWDKEKIVILPYLSADPLPSMVPE
ncbi:hypothetical protein BC835DRAFT_1360227 [Cytidiella melzeri]|nr:hypothetical protein BC835DRAFT_1360227 [Cytidiella melzeri]